jgi:hypothetical protein
MAAANVWDNTRVGFAVWLDADQAWAAGTYEYRAMGSAVISRTDLFRPGDFRRDRRRRVDPGARFAGHFASIGHVNAFLQKDRDKRAAV